MKHCLRPQPPASPPIWDVDPVLNNATYLRILDFQHEEVKGRLERLVRKQKQQSDFAGFLDPTVTVREPCWGKYDKDRSFTGRSGIHFMVSETPVANEEIYARPLWIPDTPDKSPSSSGASTPFSSTPSLTDSPLSHATTPSPLLVDVASYKLLPHAMVHDGKMSHKAGITKRQQRSRSISPQRTIPSPIPTSCRSSIRITTLWKGDDPKFGPTLAHELNGAGKLTRLTA